MAISLIYTTSQLDFMLSILWNFLQFVAFFVHLRFCFSPPESTLRENWNVLRLLNRKKKCQNTETYKSTMHDTAGSVSHTGHRLFTRTTPRIRGSDHTDHRLFSLHSNPFFSLSSSSFILSTWNINFFFFSFQLTFLSFSPCHPSSYSLLPIS